MCVGGGVPESIAMSAAPLYLLRRSSYLQKFRGIGREAWKQVRWKLRAGKGKRRGKLPAGSVVIICSAINIFLRPRSCGGEVKRYPAFLLSGIYIRRRKGEGGRSDLSATPLQHSGNLRKFGESLRYLLHFRTHSETFWASAAPTVSRVCVIFAPELFRRKNRTGVMT